MGDLYMAFHTKILSYVITILFALLVFSISSASAQVNYSYNYTNIDTLHESIDASVNQYLNEAFQGYPFTTSKIPLPTNPDGTLPPVETLPQSEQPYVDPAVPAPGQEDGPHDYTPPAFEGGGKVYVYNGPVRAYVQRFANDACNRFGTCRVSTYIDHPPAQDRALDFLIAKRWGLYAQGDKRIQGNRLANYALNRTNIVSYVIWRNRIAGYWSGYKWERYGGIGPTDGHYDHVHIGFKKLN